MNRRLLYLVILIAMAVCISGHAALAEDDVGRMYVQGLIGTMRLHEGDYTFESESGSDEPIVFEGDSANMPYLGFSLQQVLGGNRLKYGVEGGLLASWKTEKWQVAASNGTAYIRIENSMFLGDFFFGGYTSMNIGERIRLYLGGGPLLIYAQRKIDPEESGGSDDSDIVYVSTYESKWNVGAYARTGVDIIVSDQLIFGLSVRGVKTNLEFDNHGSDTQIEGVQFFFTLSAALSEQNYRW